MKAKLNNLKTYLITLVFVLAIIAASGFYVISLIENSAKIKPDKTAAFTFDWPKLYNQSMLIKLFSGEFSITPIGAQAAQATEEDNVIKYIDAFTNTDIVQTRYASKIKEDIILKQPGHPEMFEHQIDLTKYDFKKDDEGNFIFYQKGHLSDDYYQRFVILAPYLIDADNKQSSTSEVESNLTTDGRLTIKPSQKWLSAAKYPVVLDPTIAINIINVHSHPAQGENWEVSFTTLGTANLKIIPNDQATIDDDEFVSLSCDGENRQPQILAGDVISFDNWSCPGEGKVIHYTKTAGNHTLRFEFGDQVAYAYNSSNSSIIFRGSPCAAPTGGTKTTDGSYTVHTFTASGTMIFPKSGNVAVLVVAGGGGGVSGGGGGAGGLIYNAAYTVAPGNLAVTVGSGAAVSGWAGTGNSGGDSVFGTITAIGGGGGSNAGPGGAGGSGGGGGWSSGAGGSGTGGQGNNGGVGGYYYAYLGGGGGGAGSVGGNAGELAGGNGGVGVEYSQFASVGGNPAGWFAGGGGSGYFSPFTPGIGGSGGGGNGSDVTIGGDGIANTGGGGGGSAVYTNGGAGGSGIVIVRYLTSDFACPTPTQNVTFRNGAFGAQVNIDLMEYSSDGTAQAAYVTNDSGYLQSYSESTIKTQGAYALKGISGVSIGPGFTLTKTLTTNINLTDKNTLTFDIRASRTGSNIKFGIHDSGGTTSETTPNITSAGTWQEVSWNISGVANANKDRIDRIIITMVDMSAVNTFYIDDMIVPQAANYNPGSTIIFR